MSILSKRARKKLKEKLPGTVSNGYSLIQAKLPHLSRQQIEKAFNSDAHYKPEVMTAAIQIVESAKEQVKSLEKQINSI